MHTIYYGVKYKHCNILKLSEINILLLDLQKFAKKCHLTLTYIMTGIFLGIAGTRLLFYGGVNRD